MKERKKISYTIAAVLGFCGLVFLDQFTKYLASSGLKGRPPVVLIPDVLELQYLENRGAAFGSLQGMQGVFWVLTLAFLAAAVYFYIRIPKTRHYLPLTACCVVLAAGALGNFIDRVANQYVIDFIYFSVIDFPILMSRIFISLCPSSPSCSWFFSITKKGIFSFFPSESRSAHEYRGRGTDPAHGVYRRRRR